MAGMIPVVSTAIRSMGYDNGNLTVEWHSRKRTTWTGVPPRVWQLLQGASSKGRFISENVKGRFKEL